MSRKRAPINGEDTVFLSFRVTAQDRAMLLELAGPRGNGAWLRSAIRSAHRRRTTRPKNGHSQQESR